MGLLLALPGSGQVLRRPCSVSACRLFRLEQLGNAGMQIARPVQGVLPMLPVVAGTACQQWLVSPVKGGCTRPCKGTGLSALMTQPESLE